jgi:hypothetical protein
MYVSKIGGGNQETSVRQEKPQEVLRGRESIARQTAWALFRSGGRQSFSCNEVELLTFFELGAILRPYAFVFV